MPTGGSRESHRFGVLDAPLRQGRKPPGGVVVFSGLEKRDWLARTLLLIEHDINTDAGFLDDADQIKVVGAPEAVACSGLKTANLTVEVIRVSVVVWMLRQAAFFRSIPWTRPQQNRARRASLWRCRRRPPVSNARWQSNSRRFPRGRRLHTLLRARLLPASRPGTGCRPRAGSWGIPGRRAMANAPS